MYLITWVRSMILAWKDMEFVRKLGRKSKVKPSHGDRLEMEVIETSR